MNGCEADRLINHTETCLEMTADSTFIVPDAVSFEQAIALTRSLMDAMEQETVSESAVEKTVRDLINSVNGARGFFVTYLSDERPLADHPTSSVINGLYSSPDVIAPLLVKNLVMCTAMAITHRRNQKEDLAAGSDRVQSRTTCLIKALSFPQLQEQAHKLSTSLQTGTGDYQTFLERWDYDAEQKQAMYAALKQAGLV